MKFVNGSFSYSAQGLALTQHMEGLELKAYNKDGKWTIGYGHTNRVKEGDTITEEQASWFLRADVADAVATVKRLVTVELNQNQFDALVDFVFNLGYGDFKTSTLLKLLNAHAFDLAAEEFPRWKYSKGVVLKGLVRRRALEQALFTSNIEKFNQLLDA